MRYRKLAPGTNDYLFGSGQGDYLVNTPAAVAQAVKTTLLLWLGEFWLNLNAGTPYPQGILGTHSQATADMTLINQITNVQGMSSIVNFLSNIDPVTRKYSVSSCTLNTIYGPTELDMQNSADL